MKNASLETDLTDARWDYLKPMLPKPKKFGRKRTDRRVVINAIVYVLKGGIAWRLLPKNFPPWKTVYHVFRAWSLDGMWAVLNEALRICLRASQGRHAQPSAAILDSQSVKSDGHGGATGYDAGKKINGRKRHILVDTLGLVLGGMVTPASCPERDAVQQVLEQVGDWFTRLRKLWVDGGYTGDAFAQLVREHWPKLQVEVVKRSDAARFCCVAAPVDCRAHFWLAHASSPSCARLRTYRSQCRIVDSSGYDSHSTPPTRMILSRLTFQTRSQHNGSHINAVCFLSPCVETQHLAFR